MNEGKGNSMQKFKDVSGISELGIWESGNLSQGTIRNAIFHSGCCKTLRKQDYEQLKQRDKYSGRRKTQSIMYPNILLLKIWA